MSLFKFCALAAALVAHPAGAAEVHDAYFATLGTLCGAMFAGASVFPNDPADAFAGKKLVARVASCTADEIRIPFAVGGNTSRTWIIRKENGGLTLRHDHRHDDGTPDAVPMYGGAAGPGGSARAMQFMADAYTARLIPGAATNVWTLSVSADGRAMTYYLERDARPRFKAELTRQ